MQESDIKLIERIKIMFDLSRDEDVGDLLGIKKAMISEIRKGRSNLGILPKLKALDKLGYAFAREALFSITPEEFSKKVIEADNNRTKIIINKSNSLNRKN
ncbi:MAG: hypothetical protein PHW29_14165 [Flavobacterium sp.]|nr:hypothetical protein [Flavobacterium sp.]